LSDISGATVTNRYGIKLDTHTGTATNEWGLYQVDPHPNYFAGNIGIGVAPSYELDIRGTDPILRIGDSNTQKGTIYLGNSGHGIKRNYNTANDVGFWTTSGNLYLSSEGLSTSKFVLLNNGNVGIGTSTSNAPLQFANTTVNRKVVLFEETNNDNQYYGFGINAGALRYQIGNLSASHIFYAGASSTTSNELFRINGNQTVTYVPLTTAQINALTGMIQGTVVMNSTLNTLCFYNGTSWRQLSHSAM